MFSRTAPSAVDSTPTPTQTLTRAGASAAALFLLAGSVIAQTEVGNDTGWTLRPDADYVSVVNQYITNDRTAGVNGVSHITAYSPDGGGNIAAPPVVTPFGDRHLQGLRLQARAGAAGVEERYEIARSLTRSFTLNTNADIYLPTLMNAVVGVNRAAGGGFTDGSVIGSLTLQESNGAGGWNTVATSSHTAFAVTGGGLVRDEYTGNWNVPSFTGTAGRSYRLFANLRLFGRDTQNGTGSGIVGNVGTVATADQADSIPAANPSRGGFTASVAVVPTNANTNSRERVRAVAAREDFGVDGTGVRVSVLEGGSIYDTHASIAGARLDFADGVGGVNAAPQDRQRNEHTLAVASIIGSRDDNNTGNAGVAPRVTFRSVDTRSFAGGSPAALTDAMTAAPVVNMSFGSGALTPNVVDGAVNGRVGVTLVAAADNTGTLFDDNGPTRGQAENISRLSPPSTAWNAIHVGSLDQNNVKAPYSSFNGTNVGPFITVVAPGSFINSASVSGGTGDNASGAFRRIFVGNDFNKQGGAVTGEISGNSFAAPHVTGAVALMNQYATRPANGFDASAVDQRVVRAIVVNSAATAGINRMNRDFTAGAAWSQDIAGGNATPGSPLEVRRSLDPQLGGGMLDSAQALRTLASGEIRRADGNTQQQLVIDAQDYAVTRPAAGARYGKTGFWDFDTVRAQTADDEASRGRVDYLVGDLTLQEVRATLTWDRLAATQASPANLQLRLFLEGVGANNQPGWDAGDILLATTLNTLTENIKMLSLTVPEIDIARLPGYDAEVARRSFFFEVVNLSADHTDYGFVFQTVPTPSGVGLLALAGVLAARRRRA